MRGEAKSRGVIKNEKFTEKDAKKKTWVEIIPDELWDEMGQKLNLSSEYEKGTLTVHRNVTYQTYLNKLAEEIRCNSGKRYRTDSEIFRVAVHLGMNILYNIFFRKTKMLKKTRSAFFYEVLQDVERNMERATMAHDMSLKRAELINMIKHRKITRDEALAEMDKFWKAVPEEDAEYIRGCLNNKNVDNVRNIYDDLTRNDLNI